MRRNFTDSSNLSGLTNGDPSADPTSGTDPSPGALRRNVSALTLNELRKREQSAMSLEQQSMMQASRAAVVEAVACKLLEHILGLDAALAAMREAAAANAPSAAAANGGSEQGSDGGASSVRSEAQAAEDERLLADIPPGISEQLQKYILTIVRHLELPNSCIIAALIYVERAVLGTAFTLSITNWQPCLLAAFVIAAKLSFDEPVWNEDFVKALRISNVQVQQVSRWEADFLQLLSYNTNVTVSQYAQCCFTLQTAHEHMHGRQCRFFTYLMSMAGATSGISGGGSAPN